MERLARLRQEISSRYRDGHLFDRGVGLAVGLALGILFGVGIGNGGLGLVLGVALGAGLETDGRRRREQTRRP